MFATRRKEAKAVDRVILHIDMNNFYASVETLYDPVAERYSHGGRRR